MDENYIKENFDRTDKKLAYICSTMSEVKIQSELNKNNYDNLIKYGKFLIIGAWALLSVIGILTGMIVKQQVNFDNTADYTQQQEINSINERLNKVEVLNGSNRQP